jgi:hypothetical protein
MASSDHAGALNNRGAIATRQTRGVQFWWLATQNDWIPYGHKSIRAWKKVASHADMLFGIALLRRTNKSNFNDVSGSGQPHRGVNRRHFESPGKDPLVHNLPIFRSKSIRREVLFSWVLGNQVPSDPVCSSSYCVPEIKPFSSNMANPAIASCRSNPVTSWFPGNVVTVGFFSVTFRIASNTP